jgi:proline dehydrogenase
MKLLDNLIVTTLPAVPRPIVRKLSSRYVAGEDKAEALAVVRDLNRDGYMVTLDILGEFTTRPEEAERTTEEYCDLLASIEEEGLDSNVSLKLTQLGLQIDPEGCYRLARRVAEEAARRGNFLRLDMEDSTCTDATLDIHRRLRDEFGAVGCVIQAYLRRSADDVDGLVHQGANVRLCKGIYVEPLRIAFKDPAEINRSYEALLRSLLEGGCYTGIATHDERLVEAAYRIIDELELDPARYEFQMLLGVTEKLRRSILERGHRLRVYVPYGSHWYPYSIRRLKENPQLAGYALKGLFAGS